MGKVLVLDSGNKITQEVANLTGIEVERVSNLNELCTRVHANPDPYYSLIVYNSEDITSASESSGDGSNLELKIQDIRHEDSLVPHLIYGKLDLHLVSTVARGGSYRFSTNIYVADNSQRFAEILTQLFSPSRYLPNLTVVKVGGSAFDFDLQNRDNQNLEEVCKALTKIHQERDHYIKKRRVNRIIVTVGAGPFGDISKDSKNAYPENPAVQRHFPESMVSGLEMNLDMLNALFPENTTLKYECGFEFYNVTKENSAKNIILMAIAPHYILARDHIPLQDSDTHTIALAEFYGAKRIILLKRTDGIYEFDPYRGFPLGMDAERVRQDYDRILREWKAAQSANSRIGEVALEDLLEGRISREGTGIDGNPDGSKGHLMEDSALEYMASCKHIREISVVHIAPEEMYYPVGGDNYRHIVTGELLFVDPEKGWRGVLEQNIMAAFEGNSNSRIVRGN